MNPLSKFAALAAMFLALGGFAPTPLPGKAAPTAVTANLPAVTGPSHPTGAATPSAATTAHPLTAEDAAAYFDGLLPYAINRADIAGAVIVIVKDGQPLFERGYGVSNIKTRRPVDPDATLFRPGSISKTFTWTAVMQQVEAGKIDLDAPVQHYLPWFRVADETASAQITVRHLLNHTSGLPETADAAVGLAFLPDEGEGAIDEAGGSGGGGGTIEDEELLFVYPPKVR